MLRGLVLALVVIGAGVAHAKPCPKGTSHIGKRCVIDRWKAAPQSKLPPPTITLAVLHAPAAKDDVKPIEAKPTAGAVYHQAQAYRVAGDNTHALELYDKYLLLAPQGPAAPAVRAQIEKLRADGL